MTDEQIAALIEEFYASGCTRSDLLTLFELETYRDDPAWVDAIFAKPTVHDADYAVFSQYADPASAVLDIGANYGYSVASMRASGCKAKVVSIEVMPWFQPHLERVKAIEGEQHDFYIVGLGDREGVLRFVTPVVNGEILGALTSADDRAMRGWLYRQVRDTIARQGTERCKLQFIVTYQRVTTLDNLISQLPMRIVAAKIDAEGHELSILWGATATLAKHRPLLLIEGGGRSEIVELLGATGYRRREGDGVNSLFTAGA